MLINISAPELQTAHLNSHSSVCGREVLSRSARRLIARLKTLSMVSQQCDELQPTSSAESKMAAG